MAKKSRIPIGNGSIGSVLAKNVHLPVQVQSKFSNANAGIRLEGAVVLRLDNLCICGKKQLCVVFTHNDFPCLELYVMKRFLR